MGNIPNCHWRIPYGTRGGLPQLAASKIRSTARWVSTSSETWQSALAVGDGRWLHLSKSFKINVYM